MPQEYKRVAQIRGKWYVLGVFAIKSKHDNGRPKDCYLMQPNEAVKIAAPNPETGEMEGTDAEFFTALIPEVMVK